ncbi:MAG: PTS sugar transporter subunit IIA [Gemmatimonadota bacterium]
MSDAAPPVQGVLVAHGTMAEGLVDAVRSISGIGRDALTPLSNEGCSPHELTGRILDALGDGPAVLFTDLQSGSCAFAARRLCERRDDLVVMTGVNLPTLLEFVLHRELRLEDLVPRLIAKGHAGIHCTPSEMEDHAHRALSGR